MFYQLLIHKLYLLPRTSAEIRNHNSPDGDSAPTSAAPRTSGRAAPAPPRSTRRTPLRRPTCDTRPPGTRLGARAGAACCPCAAGAPAARTPRRGGVGRGADHPPRLPSPSRGRPCSGTGWSGAPWDTRAAAARSRRRSGASGRSRRAGAGGAWGGAWGTSRSRCSCRPDRHPGSERDGKRRSRLREGPGRI